MSQSIGSGRNLTAWFIVGFLVLGTVAAIIAGVMSAGQARPGDGSNIEAPAITASDWTLGSQDAKVTLIEYGDYQCPACAQYEPMIKKLLEDYKGKVLFVFRNFPLYSIHPNAAISAQAAGAAGLQGKYWEMHDVLYEKQTDWANTATSRVVAGKFDGYAASLGLDMEAFRKDINSDPVLKKIQSDVDAANAIQVSATPTFYVNLKRIANPPSYDALKKIIDDALAAP